MAKVITFSRQFPSYHPRAGEPTGFIEKVWQSLFNIDERMPPHTFLDQPGLEDAAKRFRGPYDFDPKHHTIRAGHRWKAGDWLSPRVWSGKPYRSKMIQFAPDIQVKKTWDFKIVQSGVDGDLVTNGFLNGKLVRDYNILATNDGLTHVELADWFLLCPDFKKKKVFDGQIIAWNESIEY